MKAIIPRGTLYLHEPLSLDLLSLKLHLLCLLLLVVAMMDE